MVDERDHDNGRISKCHRHVTHLDLESGHMTHHRAAHINLYQHTKFHSNWRNFLWMDVRTYVRTDGRMYRRTDGRTDIKAGFIRSTRKSWHKNSQVWNLDKAFLVAAVNFIFLKIKQQRGSVVNATNVQPDGSDLILTQICIIGGVTKATQYRQNCYSAPEKDLSNRCASPNPGMEAH